MFVMFVHVFYILLIPKRGDFFGELLCRVDNIMSKTTTISLLGPFCLSSVPFHLATAKNPLRMRREKQLAKSLQTSKCVF